MIGTFTRLAGASPTARKACFSPAVQPSFPSTVRIGLALGGGFARGIAHAGVLMVLQKHQIPIHCITGISAGAIVAAAYASGTTAEDIARAGCSMRFGDVGQFTFGRLGLMGSERMNHFLGGLLKTYRFESMPIQLGVVATDLSSGQPVVFAKSGPVFEPIRASCAFPGLFEPVRLAGQLLVDGAISTGIPAALARQLGATHVISVPLPASPSAEPSNLIQVANRCLQILQARAEDAWRRETDLVIAPELRGIDWNAFNRGRQLVQAGAAAAEASIPAIREWFAPKAAAQLVH